MSKKSVSKKEQVAKLLEKGLEQFRIRKLDKALGFLKQAYKLDPEHLNVLHGLGKIYATQGKVKEALKIYHQTLKLHPTDFMTLSYLGNIYLSQKDIDQALVYYHQAAEAKPDSIDV
ncbi:MAG: tetratricopeptide repeat protein, partial [Candidatus Heimdallarchaeota archaeon]